MIGEGPGQALRLAVGFWPPAARGELWTAVVGPGEEDEEDEDAVVRFYGYGVDPAQAFEMLRRRMVAFFESVERAGVVNLVVGTSMTSREPALPFLTTVYPPSIIEDRGVATLVEKMKGLMAAEVYAEFARLGGEPFENPINVEATEHEIAEGLKALGADGRRRFLARMARTMLDEPALAGGAGLADVVRFKAWVEERFAVAD